MRFFDGFLVVKNLVYAIKVWCLCHLKMATDKLSGGVLA